MIFLLAVWFKLIVIFSYSQ